MQEDGIDNRPDPSPPAKKQPGAPGPTGPLIFLVGGTLAIAWAMGLFSGKVL